MKLSEYSHLLRSLGYTREKVLRICKSKVVKLGKKWTNGMEEVVDNTIGVEPSGTRWVIGDSHGCSKTLKALVKKIKFNPSTDVLYLIGDYVDRGPDSKGVIDYLMHLNHGYRRVVALLGNHEQMMLDARLNASAEAHWLMNGGQATLDSFGISNIKELPTAYLSWLKSLRIYANTPGYLLSHAGLNLGHSKPFRNTDTNVGHILWNRQTGGNDPAGKVTQVLGHTPQSISEIEAKLDSPKIYIDGGCVFNKFLVALNLETKEIVTEKLIDKVVG